jgi:hypothetical protein
MPHSGTYYFCAKQQCLPTHVHMYKCTCFKCFEYGSNYFNTDLYEEN